jgi:hypothetical protein
MVDIIIPVATTWRWRKSRDHASIIVAIENGNVGWY